ncbi:protein FAM3A isoform X1 [Caloenas nicobarica]|uniref:protein FAM3A isoform X1 n=1 Tax=Caloenas nicobarica TaxID=187106 RepID=UPI0032B7A332
MRLAGPLRVAAVAGAAALTWLLLTGLLGPGRSQSPIRGLLGRAERPPTAGPRPFRPRFRCGLPRPCPRSSLAFRLVSGAANVIGPRICLDGRMLMSSGQNNVGRGLNIALVNGVNGELIAAQAFDMWAGDAEELLKFLRPLHEGTLVLVASFDDPATKLTEETRRIFADLGSAAAKDLGFRDSWVFVGAKGVQDKSPFEQHVRNSRSSNKYEGWPEALAMDGCVPRRPPDAR